MQDLRQLLLRVIVCRAVQGHSLYEEGPALHVGLELSRLLPLEAQSLQGVYFAPQGILHLLVAAHHASRAHPDTHLHRPGVLCVLKLWRQLHHSHAARRKGASQRHCNW